MELPRKGQTRPAGSVDISEDSGRNGNPAKPPSGTFWVLKLLTLFKDTVKSMGDRRVKYFKLTFFFNWKIKSMISMKPEETS